MASNVENRKSRMANGVLSRMNLIDKDGNFKKLTKKSALKKVRSALPILGWAVPYDWRENLAGDVIAGVTLAVMQVLSGKILLLTKEEIQFKSYIVL